MKNRNPKYPGRVHLTPVPGQANVYDMVRKDEPTEDGSIYSRGNVMPDAVCYAYGLDKVESEPKDVFLAIPGAMGKGLLVVTLQTASGAPIPNTLIDGLTGIDASRCRTDGNGMLRLYVDAGTYTLTSAEVNSYADISLGSTAVTVTAGEQQSVELIVSKITSKTVTTTSTIKFSPLVSAVDVFCVGGGGGGSCGGAYSGVYNGSGGGGGYTTTTLGVTVSAGQLYNAIIGSGGAGGTPSNGAGSTGGTTSMFGVSAAGGAGGGSTNGGNGGSGGGSSGRDDTSPYAGGNGGSDGSNGWTYNNTAQTAGTGQGATTRAFGDAAGDLYAGGGGGAAGKADRIAGSGGAGGGGAGGSYNTSSISEVAPSAGTPNTGGGGGGAYGAYNGGAGGSGVIRLRWVSNG